MIWLFSFSQPKINIFYDFQFDILFKKKKNPLRDWSENVLIMRGTKNIEKYSFSVYTYFRKN